MSISSDTFLPLEETANRLAAESILALPGRDEGLIPSYSLLGELRELCALEPALRDPIAALHHRLEARLDAAQPFDAESLTQLRALVDWLPVALDACKAARAVPTFAPAAAPAADVPVAPPAAPALAPVAADLLLVLDLGENRELLAEFHTEAVDHLQQIEAALLVLDQQPDNPESLNSIFRSFHTIKGNAGFLGLVPMHTLAHEVESLLDLARNHRLALTPVIITEILRSRDALQALTQQVAAALEKGQLPDVIIPVNHLVCAVRALASASEAAFTPSTPGSACPTASTVTMTCTAFLM